MERSLRLEACDHVGNIIDEMKTADFDPWEQGERSVLVAVRTTDTGFAKRKSLPLH